jgi:glycosyltransferase involved in cell wall biosynthesis
MTKVHIAVLMMVKNEQKRLLVSLESIKDIADSLVIFDTGSTDTTIQICRDFSDKYKIPLRLKQGEFVNFSTSRNVALDFADSFEDINYILLLDTNDELRGWEHLRKYAEDNFEKDISTYLVRQEWFSGITNTYFNMRFVKVRKGWRYKGVVHEYITNQDPIEDKKSSRLPPNIILYQDRTQDDDKTKKRFLRDEILLSAEYKKDPTEPRTVFYLAQTYSCLGDYEKALYYYRIRTTLIGFYEERFESCLKCGDFSEKLDLDWYDCFAWYMKAFELIPRVEPLLRIGEHYIKIKNWMFAYTILDMACKLNYPDNCILFIDRIAYEYKRWHSLSLAAYYANHIQEGKKACIKAIENGTKNNINVDRDKLNLEIYEKKEAENPNGSGSGSGTEMKPKVLTKNEFISVKIAELKKEFPKMTEKQLTQKAKTLWKSER